MRCFRQVVIRIKRSPFSLAPNFQFNYVSCTTKNPSHIGFMSKVRTKTSIADVFYKGQLLAHATLSLENFNWKLDGNILPLSVLSKLLLQCRKINGLVLTWDILQVLESSVSSINSLFQITWNFPSNCRSDEIKER